MRSLPVELCSEIVQYLDGSSSDLAAVSASTKTFHALATPPLYRHIAPRKTASVDQIVRLFHTLGDRAALVQRLELDWTAPSHHGGAVASMMNVRLQLLSALTYLAVSPALDIFTWAFDDVTMPALREFHLARWSRLDPGFFARHPHLKRVSLGECAHGVRPFVAPLPQGLEYLRMPSGGYTLALLNGLPHGTDAKLTRLDLDTASMASPHEILRLLQDSFPATSQVNIFGMHAKRVLENVRITPVDHVTRVGVPCYQYGICYHNDDELEAVLVGLARLFPSVRTLDFLGGEDGFDNHPLSYEDSARLVQRIDGLELVELVIFPCGAAYSRNGSDDFEPMSTRMDDFPQILWPDL